MIHKINFFEQLESSENILIAGAGGGFDIFAGIPLYFHLRKQGKKVIIGNFSFTNLKKTTSKMVAPCCYQIKSGDMDLTGRGYFPEKYLSLWLGIQGETTDVYAFERTGVNPLKNAYKFLLKKHQIDTIILIDGGTDSLMFGDEEGLGTPQEDICSMAAVYRTGIKKQFLVSVGFGIDDFHGVSHYRFLENVATLAKEGGYLGLFQLTKEMEEAILYQKAMEYVNIKMAGMESIVSNSILSALEGQYGDFHKTKRTKGSVLWINPLMTIYWCFDLRAVIQKNKYYLHVKDSDSMGDLNDGLLQYRNSLENIRVSKQLPI
jgi:hypothetical protein